MNTKTPCGGLLERENLCLVRILGSDWRPGQAEGILQRFADHGISLSYLSMEQGVGGDCSISLCITQANVPESNALLEDIRQALGPGKSIISEPAVILTLYGPHFMDKPALASRTLSGLARAGIIPHTISSSVNSISLVVGAKDHADTVACLSDLFEWPE